MWDAVGVGVELVQLVACEPMVVVVIVAFIIAAAEHMITHCSARRLSICGSGWGAGGVWVELGLLVGEPMGVVIVVTHVAAAEQVPLQNTKGQVQITGEKGISSSLGMNDGQSVSCLVGMMVVVESGWLLVVVGCVVIVTVVDQLGSWWW